MSIATDSLVLAGSGGDTQSVNNCKGDGNQLGKYGSFADDDDNDMEWDW